jgi:Protein of unknown function (DUF1761)
MPRLGEVTTMTQVPINYAAVVVTAIISMVIGAIWYSPPVFGKTWMTLTGKTPEDMQQGARNAYAMMFIAALVLAFVMAHVVRWAGAGSLSGGVKVGITMWIGFVLTVTSGGVIFEGRPLKLYWLNSGYHFFSLVIGGAILARWH